MAKYKYTAKDLNGQVNKGIMEANTKDEFLSELRMMGLYCMSYREIKGGDTSKGSKIKLKDLVVLSKQFATMLDSGISVVKCLDILLQQAADSNIKKVFTNVYQQVQKGNSLSNALRSEDKAFPALFISMVECGEESGTLDDSLNKMALHYEKENKLRNKVTNAMVYPAVLTVVSIGVVIILLVFVIPTFFEMFGDNTESLPAITKMLMAVSIYIRTKWYNVIGALIGIGVGIWLLLKSSHIKRKFDKWKFTMPIIGPLNKIIASARFAETMSTLYSNGMSLVEVMEITQRVLGNSYIDEGMSKAKEDVSKGIPLSKAMKQVDIFPPMLCDMILVGEESGRLDEVLHKTSAFYEEEADAAVQKMVALMEPALIVVLGVMVAGIIAAVLPPMYEMMGNIQ